MLVRDKMHLEPVTLGPEASLGEAIELFEQLDIRHIPIVDEQQRLLGLLRAIDAALALAGRGGYGTSEMAAYSLPVARVMTRRPVTVGPDEPAENAAWLMLSKKLSGLPVIDDNRLIGIITDGDLLEALVELLGTFEMGTRLEIVVGETPDAHAVVSRILEERGGKVRSVSSVAAPHTGERFLIVRAYTPDVGSLINELSFSGCTVVES